MAGSLGATVDHRLETVGWSWQGDKAEPCELCSDIRSYQTSQGLPHYMFTQN